MNTTAANLPQAKKHKRHVLRNMFPSFSGLFILSMILGRIFDPPLSTVQTPKATAEPKPKLPWIKASDLYLDYKSNEAKADRNYKGQMLVIKGEVGAVGRDRIEKGMFAGVKPYVELNDYGNLWALEGIQGSVSKEDEKFLSKIKRGQPLALACVVRGENSVTGIVEADRCRPAGESEIGLPAPRQRVQRPPQR